ncbi:MAG: hypothetical protein MUE33_10860 [Cytophagaceae bacterium]|jgi:hypothetical protein|nr:hypothetical protein [Cytophagaceae bacterium]
MNRTLPLKVLLLLQTIGLLIYTTLVINIEGADFIFVFINNILSINWSGQFNLDFSCYLLLSGIWIMWRGKFSISVILLGFVAMILGIVVLAPYLLLLLSKEKGDVKRLLIGDR